MLKTVLWLIVLVICVCDAHAATCPAGQYPDGANGGACTKCTSGYWCDGDGKYQCPTQYDADAAKAQLAAIGISDVYSASRTSTWSTNAFDEISDCHVTIHVSTSRGTFLVEPAWDGTGYKITNYYTRLWYIAATGYYLSRYLMSTYAPFYSDVKECTNKPANSHYTGPGTPDAIDGGIVDRNDCPWECDGGYGRYDDRCHTLCAAGIQRLKTSTGVTADIFSTPLSSPAMHIQYGNIVCYVPLSSGDAVPGAVNINYGGRTYHTLK